MLVKSERLHLQHYSCFQSQQLAGCVLLSWATHTFPTPGALLLTLQQTILDPGGGNLFNVFTESFFLVGGLKFILCSGSSGNSLSMTFPVCVCFTQWFVYPTLLLSVSHYSPQCRMSFNKFKGILAELCPSWHFLFHFFLTFASSSKLWNSSGFLVAHLYLFPHLLIPISIIFWVSFSSALGLSFSVMTKTSLVLRLFSFLLDSKLFHFIAVL